MGSIALDKDKSKAREYFQAYYDIFHTFKPITICYKHFQFDLVASIQTHAPLFHIHLLSSNFPRIFPSSKT